MISRTAWNGDGIMEYTESRFRPDIFQIGLSMSGKPDYLETGNDKAEEQASWLRSPQRTLVPAVSCWKSPPGVTVGIRLFETFRDNLARVADRADECDFVFPSHFTVDLEYAVPADELDACDEILANPDKYDYKAVGGSPKDGTKRVRMFKYIRGFSVIAYTKEGIYRPKAEGEKVCLLSKRF